MYFEAVMIEISAKPAHESTGTELHSKTSLPFLGDPLIVLDFSAGPVRPPKTTNLQHPSYLQIDTHMVTVYLSIHRSILADICHNSVKSPPESASVDRGGPTSFFFIVF